MIKGINLDYNLLKKELQKYKLIPNFDVKSVTDRLGLKGGLKNIEKILGIKRSPITEKFCGGDALTLWKMYRATGDDYYLNLLVEYNEYDIINLKIVAEHCVKKMKEKVLNGIVKLR